MERNVVKSSNIRSIGFDPTSKTMEIEFNSGAVYEYSGVPDSVYTEFLLSESKGKYLHTQIRDKYQHKKKTVL